VVRVEDKNFGTKLVAPLSRGSESCTDGKRFRCSLKLLVKKNNLKLRTEQVFGHPYPKSVKIHFEEKFHAHSHDVKPNAPHVLCVMIVHACGCVCVCVFAGIVFTISRCETVVTWKLCSNVYFYVQWCSLLECVKNSCDTRASLKQYKSESQDSRFD
jgi:hypothetical protein